MKLPIVGCLAMLWAEFAGAASLATAAEPDFLHELRRQRVVWDLRPADIRIRDAGDEIKIGIERLRTAGRDAEAEKLAERHKQIRGLLTGPFAEPAEKDPEVEMHVVAVYEGAVPEEVKNAKHPIGQAEVKVTYTGRPIMLVLSSYDPVVWHVKLADGVKIDRVVMCGYYNNDVTGLPKDTPVEGRSERRAFGYKVEHLAGNFGDYLVGNFGLKPATFQGTYRYNGNSFIVGPEDASWRAQKVMNALEPLHREATKELRAEMLADLKKIRFPTLHTINKGGVFGGTSTSTAIYTPLGPIKSSIKPVEGNCRLGVYDADSKTYYALTTGGDRRIVSYAEGATKPLPVEGFGEIQPHTVLAIDSKRRRLFVAGRQSYFYDLKTGKITDIGEGLNGLAGLTYNAEEDVYYGAWSAYDGDSSGERIPHLVKLNCEGATLETIELRQPIYAGRYRRDIRMFVQGGKAVLLTCPESMGSEEPIPPPVTFVIDTKTGKQLFSDLVTIQDDD